MFSFFLNILFPDSPLLTGPAEQNIKQSLAETDTFCLCLYLCELPLSLIDRYAVLFL